MIRLGAFPAAFGALREALNDAAEAMAFRSEVVMLGGDPDKAERAAYEGYCEGRFDSREAARADYVRRLLAEGVPAVEGWESQ